MYYSYVVTECFVSVPPNIMHTTVLALSTDTQHWTLRWLASIFFKLCGVDTEAVVVVIQIRCIDMERRVSCAPWLATRFLLYPFEEGFVTCLKVITIYIFWILKFCIMLYIISLLVVGTFVQTWEGAIEFIFIVIKFGMKNICLLKSV